MEPHTIEDEINAVLKQLGRDHQWEVEFVILREKNLTECKGCFGCWVKSPGECVIRDDAPEITRRIIGCDVVVYLTPILFGTYSPFLKVQVDRSIGMAHPFFEKVDGVYHHRRRYGKYPRLVGIGINDSNEPDSEALFKENISRNAKNMHSTIFDVHCFSPETDKHMIERSLERLLKRMEAIA